MGTYTNLIGYQRLSMTSAWGIVKDTFLSQNGRTFAVQLLRLLQASPWSRYGVALDMSQNPPIAKMLWTLENDVTTFCAHHEHDYFQYQLRLHDTAYAKIMEHHTDIQKVLLLIHKITNDVLETLTKDMHFENEQERRDFIKSHLGRDSVGVFQMIANFPKLATLFDHADERLFRIWGELLDLVVGLYQQSTHDALHLLVMPSLDVDPYYTVEYRWLYDIIPEKHFHPEVMASLMDDQHLREEIRSLFFQVSTTKIEHILDFLDILKRTQPMECIHLSDRFAAVDALKKDQVYMTVIHDRIEEIVWCSIWATEQCMSLLKEYEDVHDFTELVEIFRKRFDISDERISFLNSLRGEVERVGGINHALLLIHLLSQAITTVVKRACIQSYAYVLQWGDVWLSTTFARWDDAKEAKMKYILERGLQILP